MTELALCIICGLLWAIYAAIKDAVVEMRKISSRAEVANGLSVSVLEHAATLESRVCDIDQKLDAIEGATSAFHDQMMRAQSRY